MSSGSNSTHQSLNTILDKNLFVDNIMKYITTIIFS